MKAAVCEHVCNRNVSTNVETCSCNRGFRLDANAVNCSGMHDDGFDLTMLLIEMRPCFLFKQTSMNAAIWYITVTIGV